MVLGESFAPAPLRAEFLRVLFLLLTVFAFAAASSENFSQWTFVRPPPATAPVAPAPFFCATPLAHYAPAFQRCHLSTTKEKRRNQKEWPDFRSGDCRYPVLGTLMIKAMGLRDRALDLLDLDLLESASEQGHQ